MQGNISIYCSFTLCLALFTHYVIVRRMKKNFLKEVVFELKFERWIQFSPAKIMEKGIRYTQMGDNMEIRKTRRHVDSAYSENLTSDQSLG